MKIRWTQNSVRFRITPTELESLQNNLPIGERLELAGHTAWSAEVLPGAPETDLEFTAGGLRIALTQTDVTRLAEPTAEGIYFKRDELRYFIEKDFPCIHPRPAEAEEANTETFAAPLDFEARKGS